MIKNILFYITYYPGYGGIEKVTTYLANYLSEQNYNVSILSFSNRADELRYQLSKQVELFFVADQENLMSVSNQNFIKEFFQQHCFDIIIYQDCYSVIHELLFQYSSDICEKLIVCEHNSPLCQLISYQNYWKHLSWFNLHDFIRKIYYPYKRFIIYKHISQRHKYLLSNCSKYILLSDKYKKNIQFLVGNKFNYKLLSISNPLTISTQSPTTMIHRKPNQALFVGRLVEDKGISYLLDIWTEFEIINQEWNLLIVGDGPLKGSIEQIIKKRKLKRISLIGARKNVEDYYKESSILLMTSIFEGFGLVLTEAMSLGTVPIAFNSFASLGDIIDDQVNGFCIKPYRIKDYVGKLFFISRNQNILKKMRQAAIRKSQVFYVQTIGQKWLNLLH